MAPTDDQNDAVSPKACETTPKASEADSVIQDAQRWRCRPGDGAVAGSDLKVIATRWRTREERTHEVSAETPKDYHIVGIALRSLNASLSVSGRAVHDGPVMAGALHITGPSVRSRCVFRGPCDTLQLYVPNDLIAECACDEPSGHLAELSPIVTATHDPAVERLGLALLGADDIGGTFGQLFADCISTAIIAHVLGSARRDGVKGRPKIAELPKWRLKRAIDYIDAHLADPVSLADIASSTGLTRMHFAAQFRGATGVRPHEYLLRRRIERAQEMLLVDGTSVVDVALSVGFQTQAHFTTVFKRFTGQPPRAWREAQRYRQSFPGDAAYSFQ